MAIFSKAWLITGKNEGGYCNTVNDNGGETYRGITRKNFPNWEGWPEVESAHLKTGQIITSLEPLVEQFYITNFWNPIKGDEIINQDAANELFDNSVNTGIIKAVSLTQKALGIPITGKMDTTTLNMLNIQNPYA